MIAAELRGGNKPSLNEALGWIGSRVDDIYGTGVGRLEDVWIDPGTGVPRWLLVKEGRFGGRTTLIPFEDATAGAGHVWIPYERDVVREAPEVESGSPLTQQLEAELRRHYAANAAPAALPESRRDSTAATPGAGFQPQQPEQPYQQGPASPPSQDYGEAPVQHPQPFAPQFQPPPPRQPTVEAGPPGALGIPVPPPPQTSPSRTARDSATYPQVNQPHAQPRSAPPMRPAPPPARPPAPQVQQRPAPQAQPPQAPQTYLPPPQPGPYQYPQNPAAAAPPPQPAPRQHVSYPQPGQYAQPAPQHVAPPRPPAPPQPQYSQPPSDAAQEQFRQPAMGRPYQQAPQALEDRLREQPAQQAPEQEQYPPLHATERLQPHEVPGAATDSERGAAADDPNRPVAIPVIHALDQPYRVEIQLTGELSISGELRGFKMVPSQGPDAPS